MRTELSSHDPCWRALPEERRELVRAWLREHGVDPNVVRSVGLTGEGHVRVERYVRGDDGRFVLRCRTHDASPPLEACVWGDGCDLDADTTLEAVAVSRPPDGWPW